MLINSQNWSVQSISSVPARSAGKEDTTACIWGTILHCLCICCSKITPIFLCSHYCVRYLGSTSHFVVMSQSILALVLPRFLSPMEYPCYTLFSFKLYFIWRFLFLFLLGYINGIGHACLKSSFKKLLLSILALILSALFWWIFI